MLTVYRTTKFPGGSNFEQFEGSAGDVIKHIFEDWVECKEITVRGTTQVVLKGIVPIGVVPWTIAIDGPQVDIAPLIYLFGIYFEQLAFANGPLDEVKKLEIVLTACCETFGLDSEEFIPRGWPEIAPYVDTWVKEWETLKTL